MDDNKIRLLKANEIECRVSIIKDNGLSLLLYKDARVDQKILDETFGPFGWKRSHQSIDGNLYCTVEIFDKSKNTWVAKQDVGTTGYTEKEKSQASDSFKRACFNWGIGRELYSAPFIWIPSSKANIQRNGDKLYCNDRFCVASITYNEEREITSLSIVNGDGVIVYELRASASTTARNTNTRSNGKQQTSAQGQRTITDSQMQSLQAELQRTGVGMDAVRKRYQIEKPEAMSEDLYKKVMYALRRTKSAA
jgi:hypothetical protein